MLRCGMIKLALLLHVGVVVHQNTQRNDQQCLKLVMVLTVHNKMSVILQGHF